MCRPMESTRSIRSDGSGSVDSRGCYGEAMISPPPSLQTNPRVPIGLSVCAGLAGLAVAVGAGLSNFYVELFRTGFDGFNWISIFHIVAVVSFVGAILALMQHDAGGPILAAAGTVMAVVVATTVTADRFELDNLRDEFPVRGLAFLGAGAIGVLAAVLGLMCLRGRGKPVFGIATTVLAVCVLGCHAALFRLDDRQDARLVRPFLGIAVILGVMVLGSFVGRAGALVAAAGAACLLPVYLDFAVIDGQPRVRLAAVATVALAAILAESLVAAVLASRQQAVQQFGQTPQGPGWAPQPAATQSYAVQLATPVTDQQPVWNPQPLPSPGFIAPVHESGGFGGSASGPRASGTPAHGTPGYLGGDESTEQLPTINEATTSMGAMFEPQRVATESAASAPVGAQWAPDPYGRHQMRYWDGRQWSQYVSNGGVSDTDPV